MALNPGDVVPGSKVEQAKARSNHLRATIAEELSDVAQPFSTDTGLALKFHGTYTQDDRDTRTQRRKAGLKPDSFHMVRTGIPGGVLSAEQYLVMDKLADSVGNGTLRVTTRQDIQFHRVYKTDLYELINLLNDALVTTLAACGDVVRNTTACPAPLPDPVRTELRDWATRISRHFKPKSRAYYDIWVDGEHAVSAGARTIESSPAEFGPEDPAKRGTYVDAGSSGSDEVEPLYGQVYLPRKFKIGFSAPGDNCTDVLINDLAVIPVVEGETITAFTLFIGGGQGKTHNKPETYPRLATPLTTVPPEELFATAEAVIKLHRDYGDRNNREHARLKYVIDDLGDERVREIIAQNLGVTRLRDADPIVLDHADDHLGWNPQEGGGWFLGVKVLNGRIADVEGNYVRSGLRAVVERFGASVRFTAREDVLLCDISDSDRPLVDEVLALHGVRPLEQWVPVALNSFACPALPTCGLALAESERFIPTVLDRLHEALDERGLGDLEVHVRMTGCPNGCSRPYTTEVAFVGRGKNRYDVHLGGEQVGVRLNEIFCENVPGDDLVQVLIPVFERYAEQRSDGQAFGNWCHEVGVAKLRAELGTEEWVRTTRS